MKQVISLILIFSVYIGLIAPIGSHFILEANAQKISVKKRTVNMNDLSNGLKFRLSEGEAGAETREKQLPAKTDPLSENQTSNLLKRIPPIKEQTDDKTEFAKRVGTLPAPKTGKMIPVKFPAIDERGTPKVNLGNTLEVIRFSPEGEINLAPDLNVTFSQPMVAVTSQEQGAQITPVELTPKVEGKWRWLGTKTLMFDATKRLPMATKFIARVPAGTKSANGQVLQKDVTWTFTTPPPKIETKIPNSQITRRDALMFISFDQEINAEAVLKTIKVSGGGKVLPIRLATRDEIEKDASLSYYAKQAQPKRWLAFRAVTNENLTENALPAASAITVTVEKGTPSAEGPLTTTQAQTFSFQTYGAMRFVKSYCEYEGSKNCSPFSTWYMQFSNPIDAGAFAKEMVKVEPAVEGLNIYPSGNYIYFTGYKKGRTTYKATVDSSLKDIFGQTLNAPATAIFKVGSAEQSLYSQGSTMILLDPTAKPSYSIYSTNYSAVKVRIYLVQPTNWQQFQNYVRRINYDDDTKKPTIPGRLVSDKIVLIKNTPDELVETRIELSEFLDDGFGHLIVDIEPTVRRDKYDRARIFTWAQATQIGLDAFVDNQELVGFATELKTGKPLSGVELSIYPNGKTVGSRQLAEGNQEQSWWEWLTSWGTSEDSIKETQMVDGNGEISETELVGEAQTNQTTANGILRLPLPDKQANQQNLLIARKGKDIAFLPDNTDYYWQESGSWFKRPLSDGFRWFTFDDRKMYRPKEEVAVKGYIRRITAGKFGDVEPIGDVSGVINFSVKDSRNNEIAKGTTNLNAFGAFDFKFSLPDNMNLGQSSFEITGAGSSTVHYFQVQEFRRPEFEVKAKVETEAPHFVGNSANVSVEAKYYAGGGLANADANWTVTASPTNYTPPNLDDYTFGTWIPWWRSYNYDYEDGGGYRPGGQSISQSFKGVTDASGKHLLKIDFESVKPPRPYNISAAVSVQDVNRQTFASSTSLLVHPSELYVGIKSPRMFVQKGESIEIESIVSDIDGKLIANRDVEIKAVLKDWMFDKGAWKEETIDEQTCNIKSADKGVICKFVAKAGGRYTITASVMDDRERFNESEITVWVAGGKVVPKRTVEQEEAQIIPNKKEYAANDVAEILVIAPFTAAECVLTLRREGLVKTERFSMKESSIVLRIPLEEKYLPNITAQVDLVGATQRTNDKGEVDTKLSNRPAFASGSINLPISTDSRRLNVSAEPEAKTLEPAGETKINIAVTDKNGEPVANSEVAVVVVDESVLALTGYQLANPMSVFYTARAAGVTDYHLRKDVLLGNPEDMKAPPSKPAPPVTSVGAISNKSVQNLPMNARKAKSESRADMAAESDNEFSISEKGRQQIGEESQINLRQNFNALVVFAPSVKTDGNGKAVVPVKLPDNLTRYRVMAVSVDTGKRFGKGESNITAKQPLMVRPSAPRFMNFGDKIELPVVVQNQTDKEISVDVAVRATNATLTAGGGRKVTIAPNDRAEIRFPVSAEKAGAARFQIAATSGKFTDAAEISLPVWTPATTEAFATYGTTDQNGAIVQPVEAPKDVFPQFGGLEITTSSTQLQELTDAFIYLYRYPYECSEQVASRMISIAALRDVLTAFKSKDMPTDAEIKASFEKDIKILQSRQRDDGSFGMWKRDRERYEYPFLTVHVAHALTLAKAKGYKVPDEMLNKTKPYLKNIETKFDEWHRKSPQVRWTISAYALYIRDMMGDKDAAKAKKLLAEATIQKMPFEALGWILSVLANDKNSAAEVETIKRFLMNRTTETAATANFVTDYGDAQWLIMYSNRRADGVLLEALIKADPNNDLIPKLVRGLLDHRTKGAWSNTQENVFILLALDKYFNSFEKVTPDFVTRIWLGNTYAGEENFAGRSIDSNLLNIPMSYLMEQNGAANLIMDKQGAGRLYYRIGMKYAPKNLNLQPADYGFTVLRSYEAIDNAEDVKQNADNSWTIKAGSRVRVRLTMVAQARRYHVALVDPLPAGLEILNPELAVTEAIPSDIGGNTSVVEYGSRSYGRGFYNWRWTWFEHQNFRDERAEAFSALLWEGVYRYTYVTRATTPGQFVVPPAKAEEMYHPETFGRTGTDFVRVK
ncbi:MAG: MG2 domain-containing protein [Acidobacteriota bacterium]|nr:MG2 domain-containing protein [Acidobacteriota bacterium]